MDLPPLPQLPNRAALTPSVAVPAQNGSAARSFSAPSTFERGIFNGNGQNSFSVCPTSYFIGALQATEQNRQRNQAFAQELAQIHWDHQRKMKNLLQKYFQ